MRGAGSVLLVGCLVAGGVASAQEAPTPPRLSELQAAAEAPSRPRIRGQRTVAWAALPAGARLLDLAPTTADATPQGAEGVPQEAVVSALWVEDDVLVRAELDAEGRVLGARRRWTLDGPVSWGRLGVGGVWWGTTDTVSWAEHLGDVTRHRIALTGPGVAVGEGLAAVTVQGEAVWIAAPRGPQVQTGLLEGFTVRGALAVDGGPAWWGDRSGALAWASPQEEGAQLPVPSRCAGPRLAASTRTAGSPWGATPVVCAEGAGWWQGDRGWVPWGPGLDGLPDAPWSGGHGSAHGPWGTVVVVPSTTRGPTAGPALQVAAWTTAPSRPWRWTRRSLAGGEGLWWPRPALRDTPAMEPDLRLDVALPAPVEQVVTAVRVGDGLWVGLATGEVSYVGRVRLVRYRADGSQAPGRIAPSPEDAPDAGP